MAYRISILSGQREFAKKGKVLVVDGDGEGLGVLVKANQSGDWHDVEQWHRAKKNLLS